MGDNNDTTKATSNTKWKTVTDSDGWTTVKRGYSSEPEKTGTPEPLSIDNARYFSLWAGYLKDEEPEEPMVRVAVISAAEEDEGDNDVRSEPLIDENEVAMKKMAKATRPKKKEAR